MSYVSKLAFGILCPSVVPVVGEGQTSYGESTWEELHQTGAMLKNLPYEEGLQALNLYSLDKRKRRLNRNLQNA